MTIQQIIGLAFLIYGILYACWWIPKTLQLRKERRGNRMTDKQIFIMEQEKKLGYYRCTVGSLKKALQDLDDDAPIGVRFDGGYAYTDINELLLTESGLYILNCD